MNSARARHLPHVRSSRVRPRPDGHGDPDQRWGLGDPLPDAVHVEQKNGWGPMSTGYRLNSFGFVSGCGRSYQLAILSKSPNGFTYGKATINRVSRIVYDALDDR